MATKSKVKATEQHFARYTGGIGSIRHSGRLSKVVPFQFNRNQWVTIPLDPYWMCEKCNKKYRKSEFPSRPDYCGNEILYMESIQGAVGNISAAGIARRKVCDSKTFTDTVQRRFFEMKADKNPQWEYKTE